MLGRPFWQLEEGEVGMVGMVNAEIGGDINSQVKGMGTRRKSAQATSWNNQIAVMGGSSSLGTFLNTGEVRSQ